MLNLSDNPYRSYVQVQLQDTRFAPGGSVDLVLRMNPHTFLGSIDTQVYHNGEATGNPIPAEPTFTYANQDFCNKHARLKYIIYVHTSPPNVDRRMNLRDTWANAHLFNDERTKVVFFVGETNDVPNRKIIESEIQKYDDIVQGHFNDDYHNLTLKGILALKWVSTYCKQAQFVIKADDDAFVNIFTLTSLLESYTHGERLVTCAIWQANSMPILRDPATCAKWCVKHSEFPGRTRYPQYCAGLSYTMSRDVVRDMYRHASSTPFFWVDDVYITGLLLGKTNNVKYVDLMRNFTSSATTAVKQYTDDAVAPTYVMSHVHERSDAMTLWHSTLKKLPIAQLSEVNKTVYSSFPDVVSRVDAPNKQLASTVIVKSKSVLTQQMLSQNRSTV